MVSGTIWPSLKIYPRGHRRTRPATIPRSSRAFGKRAYRECRRDGLSFREENNLATIVGTKTPGRLLSGSAYKVGHGYILGLPVAAYLTWQGRMLENNGITPKFFIELSREALREGRDTQLETAVQVAKAL